MDLKGRLEPVTILRRHQGASKGPRPFFPLVALTAAAFLPYLRPEAVMDFANRFYLCY